MRIKIKVMKMACYKDLIEEYENPILEPCNMKIGMEFIIDELKKPKLMCDSAWETLYPFVKDLFDGKDDFFDGWMKNKKSAMISCNDGFRPVSFYVEAVE